MMKKMKAASLIIALMLILSSCSAIRTIGFGKEEKNLTKIGLVLDLGGEDDHSFNMMTMKAFKQLAIPDKIEARSYAPKSLSAIGDNIAKLVDNEAELIFSVGFNGAKLLKEQAEKNEDISFVSLYNSYDSSTIYKNLTGSFYKNQESAFLAGYIAAYQTKINEVGFIGSQKGAILSHYENGFKSGVLEAEKELKRTIKVDVEYLDTYTDENIGRNVAKAMYEKADVIYQVAGKAGIGVVEEAKSSGKWVIGSEYDQSFIAPKNVLTSTVNDFGKALDIIAQDHFKGENIGGKNYIFGVKEGVVGLSPYPEEKAVLEKSIYDRAMALVEKIKSGALVPAKDEAELNRYTKEKEK